MRPDFHKTPLIPVIVQDYRTRQVLMLAYANEESYERMLATGDTCFYSRSRQALWHKGETSGHYQHVKGMYLDCDHDTLLVYVEQIGAACHTGAKSCFFEEILPFDGADIFHELEELIKERRKQPLENSYTNYLLNEGVDKICKKLGEEAAEVIIAAKNGAKPAFVGEAGDLLYHLFVLMNEQGVSLADIEDKLRERHRKSQNKKEPHTRGAD